MSKKFNENRALLGKWKSLEEAAFYTCRCVNKFNSDIRPLVTEPKNTPIVFDRDELDRAMDSLKIGNLPGNRVPTSTAKRRQVSAV